MAHTNDAQKYADLTREALADVREGLVIDHKLIEALVLSLNTNTPMPLPTPEGPN